MHARNFINPCKKLKLILWILHWTNLVTSLLASVSTSSKRCDGSSSKVTAQIITTLSQCERKVRILIITREINQVPNLWWKIKNEVSKTFHPRHSLLREARSCSTAYRAPWECWISVFLFALRMATTVTPSLSWKCLSFNYKSFNCGKHNLFWKETQLIRDLSSHLKRIEISTERKRVDSPAQPPGEILTHKFNIIPDVISRKLAESHLTSSHVERFG